MPSDQPYEIPVSRHTGRNLAELASPLTEWFRNNLDPGLGQVAEIKLPEGSGANNETLLVRLEGGLGPQRYVVRMENHNPFHSDYDFRIGYHTCVAIRKAGGPPCARVVALEEDASIIGDRFYVMEHLDGLVAPDKPNFNQGGWVADATVDVRRNMSRNFARTLAQLHAMDTGHFGFLARPELGKSGLEQDMRYWMMHGDIFGVENVPEAAEVLTEAKAWLIKNFPANPPTSFSWGDARFQNTMFTPDGEVLAALDWDVTGLAGPASDIANYIVSDHNNTTAAGHPRLPGICNGQELIDMWEEYSGRTLQDFDWHLVYAAYRQAIIYIRLATLAQPQGGPYTGQAEALIKQSAGLQWVAILLDLKLPFPITRPFLGLDK